MARNDYYSHLERIHFYAGDVIFREGRPGHEAYIIQKGEVEIFTGPEENATVLAHIGPRSIFGEMALVTHQPRSASAKALRNTTCFIINAQDFRARLGEVSPFMQVIIRVLAENVRQSNSQIDAAVRRIRSQERVLNAVRRGAQHADGDGAPKVRSSKGVVRGE